MKRLLTLLIILISLTSYGQFGMFQAHNRGYSVTPETFVEQYGLMYNYHAISDTRGISSGDFSVPTKNDIDTLLTYLGGASIAGGKLKMTGFANWNSPNTGATNESGFSAFGSGIRGSGGSFTNLKSQFWIHSSNEPVGGTFYFNLSSTSTQALQGFISDVEFYKKNGIAVRLVRDATAGEQLLADGTALDPYIGTDGTSYETVKIGNQVWTARNLRETRYANGDLIPNVTDNTEWSNLTTGALCSYDNVEFTVPEYTPSSTLLEGLVAAWEMNEPSGTTMIDSHTNGLDGTITGVTLNGSEYSFNGTSDYVEVLDNDLFSFTDNIFSFEVWFKLDNLTGIKTIIRKTSEYHVFATNDALSIRVFENGTSTFYYLLTSSILDLNWHHLVVTCEGLTIGDLKLFLDGTEITTGLARTSGTNLIANTANSFNIGRQPSTSNYWGGDLRKLWVWNKTLTASEITDLYNDGTPLTYAEAFSGSSTEQTFLTSADYYVSSSTGSDTNDGLTQETAWASLSKLSTETFSADDTIAFKAGDSFEGDFTPPSSGTLGSPITFSAYGTGAKPKIYGSTEITGWTLHSGNIYKATVGTAITQLFVDDVRMSNSRFPNSGYATVTGTSSTTNITSTDLNGSIDYSGALVVGRVAGHRWRLKRSEVASSSGQTLTLGPAISPLAVNDGFFLMNKLDFLDTAGEWVYDSGTGTVYLWVPNGDSPSNYTVRGSIYDRGIDLNYRQHITVENLDIRHQKIDGVRVRFSEGGINIHDNTFADQELSAINVNAGTPSNIVVDNNVISGQNSYGILMWTGTNMEVTNNLISDVFLIKDFGLTRSEYGVGIDMSYNVGDYIVTDNTIQNVGYNGMNINGTNVVAEYNYIENACLTTDDGGAIYANGIHSSPTDMIVQYNIIKNVESGALPWWTNNFGNGLYSDNFATNITFQYNTVINSSYFGIYLHENENMLVQYNTVLNALKGYVVTAGQADNNTVSNNIIMNDASQSATSRLVEQYLGTPTLLTANNNRYVDHSRTDVFRYNAVTYDFAGWKTATGQDTSSSFDGTALGVGEVEEIFYNNTKTNKAFTLTGSYRDLDGVDVSSPLTLQPFTSQILIKE